MSDKELLTAELSEVDLEKISGGANVDTSNTMSAEEARAALLAAKQSLGQCSVTEIKVSDVTG